MTMDLKEQNKIMFEALKLMANPGAWRGEWTDELYKSKCQETLDAVGCDWRKDWDDEQKRYEDQGIPMHDIGCDFHPGTNTRHKLKSICTCKKGQS